MAIPLPTNLGADACAGVGFTGNVLLDVKDGAVVGHYTLTRVLAPIYWPMGFTLKAISLPPPAKTSLRFCDLSSGEAGTFV